MDSQQVMPRPMGPVFYRPGMSVPNPTAWMCGVCGRPTNISLSIYSPLHTKVNNPSLVYLTWHFTRRGTNAHITDALCVFVENRTRRSHLAAGGQTYYVG